MSSLEWREVCPREVGLWEECEAEEEESQPVTGREREGREGGGEWRAIK